MNAKALAQEVTSWYLSHLDPYSPHTTNVESYLRVPVLGLTLQILATATANKTESNGLELEAPQQGDTASSGSSHDCSWKSLLKGKGSDGVWTEQDQRAFSDLGRRTRARMDAFIAGCSLAVPDDTTDRSSSSASLASKHGRSAAIARADSPDISFKEGLAGLASSVATSKQQGKKSGSPMLAAALGKQSINKVRYPQFRGAELTLRLELYIRTLMRTASTGQECVVTLEAPKTVKARALTVVRSFVATVGCVRSLRPTLTNLMQNLTKELLAVDTLCEDISKVIGRKYDLVLASSILVNSNDRLISGCRTCI
jgi:hypothetical protein